MIMAQPGVIALKSILKYIFFAITCVIMYLASIHATICALTICEKPRVIKMFNISHDSVQKIGLMITYLQKLPLIT